MIARWLRWLDRLLDEDTIPPRADNPIKDGDGQPPVTPDLIDQEGRVYEVKTGAPPSREVAQSQIDLYSSLVIHSLDRGQGRPVR